MTSVQPKGDRMLHRLPGNFRRGVEVHRTWNELDY
jgi:hypothetical protein